jgi:hypothetical protein
VVDVEENRISIQLGFEPQWHCVKVDKLTKSFSLEGIKKVKSWELLYHQTFTYYIRVWQID